MSIIVEVLVLIRSVIDLIGSAVEAYARLRGREDEYVPRHLAKRRSGSARRDKKGR